MGLWFSFVEAMVEKLETETSTGPPVQRLEWGTSWNTWGMSTLLQLHNIRIFHQKVFQRQGNSPVALDTISKLH